MTPMSIFVLNLATLLGLGLGVDYSLLLTSRFREEMAGRARGRPGRASRRPSRRRVATAGRAVFFSGLTVLLGLLGLVLFEFMILRSVGIAGRDRRVPRGRVGGDAAAGAARDRRHPDRRAGDPPDAAAATTRTAAGPASPAGSCAARSRSSSRRSGLLLVLGWPFLHVRFNAPDSTILPASVPSRAAFDRLAATFGEGEFAPLTLAIRTTGPATSPENLAALYDYSRRLAADPADQPRRGPRRRRPAAGPRPVPAALRRPERPARPVHRDGPRRDDEGRPDRVHGLHAVRPEPRRGPRARRATSATRPGRSLRRRA